MEKIEKYFLVVILACFGCIRCGNDNGNISNSNSPQTVKDLSQDFFSVAGGDYQNSKNVELSIRSDSKEILYHYPSSEFRFLAVIEVANCASRSKNCSCTDDGCRDLVAALGKCELLIKGRIDKVVSEYDLMRGQVAHLYWTVLESEISYLDKKVEGAKLLEVQGWGTLEQQAKFICVHKAVKHSDPTAPDTITYQAGAITFESTNSDIFRRIEH